MRSPASCLVGKKLGNSRRRSESDAAAVGDLLYSPKHRRSNPKRRRWRNARKCRCIRLCDRKHEGAAAPSIDKTSFRANPTPAGTRPNTRRCDRTAPGRLSKCFLSPRVRGGPPQRSSRRWTRRQHRKSAARGCLTPISAQFWAQFLDCDSSSYRFCFGNGQRGRKRL